MRNENQWHELLKQSPLGMGSSDLHDKNQENQSANKGPEERKKTSKLKLGLIKG